MSYCSRIYRQRNANTYDKAVKEPFFSKKNDIPKIHPDTSFFQAKLSIDNPGDNYEREADAVANAVINNQPFLASSTGDTIQKKKLLKPVQAKQDANAGTALPGISPKIGHLPGNGNALSSNSVNEMSTAFGVDFSDVKVHHDEEAAVMNDQLQAHAFTHGSDIYFNEGKYNPESGEGKFLLAHELTHVLQQEGHHNLQKKDDKNKKKQKFPQDFICYTGGHSGIVSVFKSGLLIFSGYAVSGQPGSKQNEKGIGPTPDGTYVIHPQKTNSPVDKGQDGTCAANAISSGYQELSSNEKFACDHPSHYCTETCAESPVNHCFTPVGCWGTKRIKIEGSAQVVTDDGKRITRSGFYFHGGNPSNLASSGCIKVLDNTFFSKARELKGSIPVFVGNTCPGLDLNAVLFSFTSLFP
jgi:hypothetical protein